MYILENEFCEIVRLQACGNVELSFGTVVSGKVCKGSILRWSSLSLLFL